MGKYPWVWRRQYFIRKGPQGRFVFGLALIVTVGLIINVLAAYFLIDHRLSARLYKIHLQVGSTLDIIWPVIWKLSLVSAFFVAITGVALGYYLMRSLDIALLSYLKSMRMAGEDGNLTVRALDAHHDLPALGESFNMGMRLLDERFGRVKRGVSEIDASMKGITGITAQPAEPLRRKDLIEELDLMISRSDEALNEISIFRV